MDAMNPFLKALELLDERGWHQGDFEGEDGSLCLYGAISVAIHGDNAHYGGIDWSTEGKYANLILDDCFKYSQYDGSIGEWNDDPLRTEEDVRLKLKEMAQLWEERYESISKGH